MAHDAVKAAITRRVLSKDEQECEHAEARRIALRWRERGVKITIFETIVKGLDRWPEGISDGLALNCARCGRRPYFDYVVDDSLWRALVPLHMRSRVVCLPCLFELGKRTDWTVAEHIQRVQYSSLEVAIVFEPTEVYYFK